MRIFTVAIVDNELNHTPTPYGYSVMFRKAFPGVQIDDGHYPYVPLNRIDDACFEIYRDMTADGAPEIVVIMIRDGNRRTSLQLEKLIKQANDQTAIVFDLHDGMEAEVFEAVKAYWERMKG